MRLRRMAATLVAGMLVVGGLGACGRQSAMDAAEDFMNGLADADIETVLKYADVGDVPLAKVRPETPISDVKVEKTENDSTVNVSFDLGKKRYSRSLALKESDDGWKINAGSVLVKASVDEDDVDVRLDGKKVPDVKYLIPGKYKATADGGFWTASWDVTADDYSERGLRVEMPSDAVIKPNDKFTTDDEVLGRVRSSLEDEADTCNVLLNEMLDGKDFDLIVGDSIAKACRSSNGITDASDVTVTGWESGSEPNEFTLTLGGTYTGEKATFQNVDDSRDLSAQGWTCQYVHGIDTNQQCALFGPAELPADGLKVTYTIDPSFSDGVAVPEETVQAVADALYEGHAVD